MRFCVNPTLLGAFALGAFALGAFALGAGALAAAGALRTLWPPPLRRDDT